MIHEGKNTKYYDIAHNRKYLSEGVCFLPSLGCLFRFAACMSFLRGACLSRRDIACARAMLPSVHPCRDVGRFRRSCRRWRNGAHRTCCPDGGRLSFPKSKFLCRRIHVVVATHHSAKRGSVERNPHTFHDTANRKKTLPLPPP